jgi:hypothetical protein
MLSLLAVKGDSAIGRCGILLYISTVQPLPRGASMATGKTSTLTFRIEPAMKEALRTAAERE